MNLLLNFCLNNPVVLPGLVVRLQTKVILYLITSYHKKFGQKTDCPNFMKKELNKFNVVSVIGLHPVVGSWSKI